MLDNWRAPAHCGGYRGAQVAGSVYVSRNTLVACKTVANVDASVI